MPPRQQKTITYTGLRGRDGYPMWPGEIPKHRALECLNVDGYRAGFARKRGGATNIFSTTTLEAFTGTMSALVRHVPGADPTAAEFWGVDNAATPVVQRLTGGTAWSTPTLKDDLSGSAQDVVGVSFNGKLYLAYDSAVDRLHVWDGSTVRRSGLSAAANPGVGNTGVGTYPATTRFYKIVFAKQVSGVNVLLSDFPSAAGSGFTPSGTGTAAQLTKPAAINEGETHWLIYGSAADASLSDANQYHLVATVAVGTTTYDDSVLPTLYTGDAPALIGSMTKWTSVKYLMATDGHILGAGSWESGGKNNRVWWSGVTGQIASVDNDEVVIQTTEVSNYVDLDENDGGVVTGLGGPLDGRPLVFKRNQVWRLVPTGLDNPFYRPRPIYKGSGIGCIRHHTIVNAEDAAGRPCVYWLSDIGPYRLGADGPQCLVDDIMDLWTTINLAASAVVAHGVYHPDKRQIWWWIATGSSNDPDTKIVFDVRLGRAYEDGRVRDGWYRHGGDSAAARCSCLFSNTLGAAMSRDLKPHIGRSTGTTILKCDTADLDDAGAAFQGYVDLPDTHFAGIDTLCQMGQPVIVGSAGSHSLGATMVRDYGEETRGPATVSMAAGGADTRVTRLIEGVETADAHAVRVRIGDSAAIANAWTIDAVALRVETRETM